MSDYVFPPEWPSYKLEEFPARPRHMRFDATAMVGSRVHCGIGRNRDRALADLEREIEKANKVSLVEVVRR